MADSAHGVQAVRGDEALTVRESITVNRAVADAFRLFTDGIGEWWPLKGSPFSYGGDRADKIFLETKVGGRFYERFSDGEEFEVGRVIACEPPTRIVFTWMDPKWKAQPKSRSASLPPEMPPVSTSSIAASTLRACRRTRRRGGPMVGRRSWHPMKGLPTGSARGPASEPAVPGSAAPSR